MSFYELCLLSRIGVVGVVIPILYAMISHARRCTLVKTRRSCPHCAIPIHRRAPRDKHTGSARDVDQRENGLRHRQSEARLDRSVFLAVVPAPARSPASRIGCPSAR